MPIITWSGSRRRPADAFRHSVPGVSLAVINDRAIEWADAWGVLERGSSQPVTTDTLFQAASISKPVAAVAALRLVERGVLDLDADVNTKLVDWKIPEGPLTHTAKVTLRRILSHSAGLTVHGFPGYAPSEPLPTVVQILDGTRPANTSSIRVDLVPGSRWRYSGGGFVILQKLVTDVTGRRFSNLMDELVLGPAGMSHSTFVQPLPEPLRANAARGHWRYGSTVQGGWHVYPEQAAAGLWTTPSDLARFALALQGKGGPDGILSASMRDAMLTVQSGPSGLGMLVSASGDRFRHDGWNAGFRCRLVVFPRTGQGAVVMTNGDAGDAVFSALMQALAAQYRWPS